MEISVIVPVFNRPHLLADALASVLAQTYQDFEIVVVDDGSTDETPEVLARVLREVPKQGGAPPARTLRVPHSGKPGAVRNRGAEEARGRLLAFLDSDDRWLPTKLEAQVRLHEGAAGAAPLPGTGQAGPAARCSHTRELWVRRGREVSQKGQRHRRSGDLFVDSLKKCIIGPSTVMLERSLFEELGGFREDLEIAEDYELWLRATHRVDVAYLDEALTIKQAGDWPQLSERYGQIEVFRIEGLKGLIGSGYFADNPEHQAAAETEFARKCRIYAAGCRKRGRPQEARKFEALARGL
jgi:glycosyltransferase involved in cell wall biosynthesis